MQSDRPSQRSPDHLPQSLTDEPLRVLLVEDDAMMRDLLTEAMVAAGFEVRPCAEATRWLKFCFADNGSGQSRALYYDVVVADIRMPRMGGLDVMRILSATKALDQSPPAILITGFGDDLVRQLATELGAVELLDKPFAVEDLIERVRLVAATTGGRPSDDTD